MFKSLIFTTLATLSVGIIPTAVQAENYCHTTKDNNTYCITEHSTNNYQFQVWDNNDYMMMDVKVECIPGSVEHGFNYEGKSVYNGKDSHDLIDTFCGVMVGGN